MKKLRLDQRHVPLAATLVVCVLLYVLTGFQYPSFFSPLVLADLFSDNARLGIAALGSTFVILSGGIDLSVASVMALATMFMAAAVERFHLHPAIAIVFTLLVGSGVGYLNGALIHFFDLPPFLVTLATLFLARGCCFLISMSPVAAESPFFQSFGEAGLHLGTITLHLGTIVFAGVAIACIYAAHFTRFGRTVYAMGGNEQAARLMGLPVGKTKILVYVFGGLTAALAGIMAMANIPSGDPLNYLGQELDVIAAVVIGGTVLTGGVGYLAGTVLGVLILGIMQDFITFGNRDAAWTQITTGLLLFVFVAMQTILSRWKPRARNSIVGRPLLPSPGTPGEG